MQGFATMTVVKTKVQISKRSKNWHTTYVHYFLLSGDQIFCINGCDTRRMTKVEAADLPHFSENVTLVVTRTWHVRHCVDVLWGGREHQYPRRRWIKNNIHTLLV